MPYRTRGDGTSRKRVRERSVTQEDFEMGKHVKRIVNFWSVFVLTLVLGAGGATAYARMAEPSHVEFAGASIVGEPKGATDRALFVDQSGSSVKRVVFFAAGMQTPAVGANTPVVSSSFCGFAARTLFRADAYVVGTMAGTNPTLDIKWQHSIDGGTTWINVGTWTQLTNTSITTPANVSQSQVVSDVWNNTTAVAYGDCWRATKTYTGTGPGANVEVAGMAK